MSVSPAGPRGCSCSEQKGRKIVFNRSNPAGRDQAVGQELEYCEDDVTSNFCLFSSLFILHLIWKVQIAAKPCLAEQLSSEASLACTAGVLLHAGVFVGLRSMHEGNSWRHLLSTRM